jgi:hypothetical protein
VRWNYKRHSCGGKATCLGGRSLTDMGEWHFFRTSIEKEYNDQIDRKPKSATEVARLLERHRSLTRPRDQSLVMCGKSCFRDGLLAAFYRVIKLSQTLIHARTDAGQSPLFEIRMTHFLTIFMNAYQALTDSYE